MCSRSDRAARPARGAAAALALAVALALAALAGTCAGAGPAWGIASLEDRAVEAVAIERVAAAAFGVESAAEVADGGGSGALAVPRFCPTALSAACDPASIEAGVDCGMDWMCGIEPCLCGSADAWGGCSCNGLETRTPELAFSSSDEGVVRVVEALGRTWLVPTGAGTATLTCTASLAYHGDAVADVTVTVDGPQLADALLAGTAVLAVGLAAAAVFGVRALVRVMRRGGADDAAREDMR